MLAHPVGVVLGAIHLHQVRGPMRKSSRPTPGTCTCCSHGMPRSAVHSRKYVSPCESSSLLTSFRQPRQRTGTRANTASSRDQLQRLRRMTPLAQATATSRGSDAIAAASASSIETRQTVPLARPSCQCTRTGSSPASRIRRSRWERRRQLVGATATWSTGDRGTGSP
jgi:hypothetical protein